MNIIPHYCERFDFDSFAEELKSNSESLDYRDFLYFFKEDSIIHVFTGLSAKGNRVSSALGDALMIYEGMEAIAKASSVALVIYYSTRTDHPLRIDELQSIGKTMELITYQGELTWNLMQDDSLGNNVKVRVFVRI